MINKTTYNWWYFYRSQWIPCPASTIMFSYGPNGIGVADG